MFEIFGWWYLRAAGYGWLWGREHYAKHGAQVETGGGGENDVFGNGGNLLIIGFFGTILLIALIFLIPSLAQAATECTTRKSGSVTITSCSSSKNQPATTCRSYMSGSVRKTTCSS